jgi:hypothetical protein
MGGMMRDEAVGFHQVSSGDDKLLYWLVVRMRIARSGGNGSMLQH